MAKRKTVLESLSELFARVAAIEEQLGTPEHSGTVATGGDPDAKNENSHGPGIARAAISAPANFAVLPLTAVEQPLKTATKTVGEADGSSTAVEVPFELTAKQPRTVSAISEKTAKGNGNGGGESWDGWGAIAKVMRCYTPNIAVKQRSGEARSPGQLNDAAVRAIVKNGKKKISAPSEWARNCIIGAALFANRNPSQVRSAVSYVMDAIADAAALKQMCPDDEFREAGRLFLTVADTQPVQNPRRAAAAAVMLAEIVKEVPK